MMTQHDGEKALPQFVRRAIWSFRGVLISQPAASAASSEPQKCRRRGTDVHPIWVNQEILDFHETWSVQFTVYQIVKWSTS